MDEKLASTYDLIDQYIITIQNRKKRRKRILHLFLLVSFVCILFNIFGIAKVNSDAMLPTYHNGQIIIYVKHFSELQKDDVVLIEQDNQIIMRRVIGVYHDQIDIDNENGCLMINGKNEESDYSEGLTLSDPLGVKFPLYVSKKQVFVLCDQRNITSDSRIMGCIYTTEIIGKVICKI